MGFGKRWFSFLVAPFASQLYTLQIVGTQQVPGFVHQCVEEVNIVLYDFNVKKSDWSILVLLVDRLMNPLNLARAVVEPGMIALKEQESSFTIGFQGTDVP
jgi:hypothetical protein